MMLWLAIGGYLVGLLGTGVAFGARLRIASLEQELAHYQRLYRTSSIGSRSRGPGGTGTRNPLPDKMTEQRTAKNLTEGETG